MIEPKETLASFLQKLMDSKGFSQRRLAKESGVDRGHINAFIKGRRKRMGRQTAERLAPILDVPLSSFFTFDLVPRPLQAIVSEVQQVAERLEVIQIPIVGGIPAGYPSLEDEYIEGYVTVVKEELGAVRDLMKLFALRVNGNSLLGDEIYHGDFVIIEPESELLNGKIYALRLGNEVVARHVYKLKDKLKLVSSNTDYELIETDETEILGRVILSIRAKKH